MTRSRSLFVGATDYTGVSLDDILEHLRGWREGLDAIIERLPSVRARLAAHGASPVVRDGVAHCDYFVDLCTRYRSDINRLIVELPQGVSQRHVELVEQLYRSSTAEEHLCVLLKQRHYLDCLPSDATRPEHTLAEIYRDTRDEMLGMRDLGTVAVRLRTFVSHQAPTVAPAPVSPAGSINALELKPNFFGVGLNLNYIIERWGHLWRRGRKRDTQP